jgi:hypothetical protein
MREIVRTGTSRGPEAESRNPKSENRLLTI